ncbi:uncharacterized protein SCODWIG_00280 [Saccharomycodes ludwigii]|uniref:Uncharacterized protein n=1 Tax=Saccharomycodes ludwigii TaxID=36035 RepID=A0A376B1L7_9ASCO|nr:hypothetical protein SCDLUD_002142 [Saccharomycodes ludwigii]KAH3902322.1 hypothetical protein SCDLUD_002142 [Saccharomycodes ludwigii]SSD58519.1 uncharacterized protein SCODWIG_00280 [Saccharomycodes ludwigii]
MSLIAQETKRHLIIVPGHSVWKKTNDPLNLGQLSDHWVLAPFQLEGNDHLTMIKHGLKAIIELVKEYDGLTDQNLILYSGSKTKVNIDQSEGKSYYELMKRLLLETNPTVINNVFQNLDKQIIEMINEIHKIGKINDVFKKDVINYEEYALDSFENLYYSILKFKQLNSSKKLPNKITIVGFEFKRKRFVELHAAKALGYNNLEYIGIDPNPIALTAEKRVKYFADLAVQENKYGYEPFVKDWYGVKVPLLEKKLKRNVFNMVAADYYYPYLVDLKHDGDDFEFYTKVVKPSLFY